MNPYMELRRWHMRDGADKRYLRRKARPYALAILVCVLVTLWLMSGGVR